MPEDKRYNDEDRILENRVIKEDALMRPMERKNRRRTVAYTVMVLAAAAAFFAVVFTVFFKMTAISVSGGAAPAAPLFCALSSVLFATAAVLCYNDCP